MKTSSPTYLYRFKDSRNYFFRFRMNSFKNIRYINHDGHFVASLRTPSYEDARWLAFYIKRNLMKEISMECFSKSKVKSFMYFGDKLTPVDSWLKQEPAYSNAQFNLLLKKRFAELLKVGKLMLEHGLGQHDDLQSPFSDEQMQALKSAPERVVPASEQAAMLNVVSGNEVDVGIDPEHKYLDYREMINKLTVQLCELKTQLDDYRLEATATSQGASTQEMCNFTMAMADHSNIKKRIDEQHANTQSEMANFYSVDHQLSLFLQEKTHH